MEMRHIKTWKWWHEGYRIMEMVSENKIRPLLNSVGAFARSPRQPQPPHAAASRSATA